MDQETEKRLRPIYAYKTIAMIGMSPDETRASYVVGNYLKDHGYDVIPIRPGTAEIAGLKAYPDLKSVDRPIDVVDVFRKAEDCVPVAQDAVAVGAKVLWLQEGVVNEQAATIAREAGLVVVMDRCIKKTHTEIFGS